MFSPSNLAEVLGKINDGICVLSWDRQVSFMNEKAEQIFNSADETFHERISTALRERCTKKFEYFHASLNRWFEHHVYPNTDGGLTIVSCDITSHHRLEEALRSSE